MKAGKKKNENKNKKDEQEEEQGGAGEGGEIRRISPPQKKTQHYRLLTERIASSLLEREDACACLCGVRARRALRPDSGWPRNVRNASDDMFIVCGQPPGQTDVIHCWHSVVPSTACQPRYQPGALKS